MEYQKIINLFDNTVTQPSKLWTRKWVGTNYDPYGQYNTCSQIKFRITISRSRLCDYSNVYILVKGTVIITGVAEDSAERQLDEINKTFKKLFVHQSLFA